MKNICERLFLVKVARVGNIYLGLMDCFFNNLAILMKQCKIQYKNLDEGLLFSWNQVLKNWKLWWAPTTIGFNIFFVEILHTFHTCQCLQKDVQDLFLIYTRWNWLRKLITNELTPTTASNFMLALKRVSGMTDMKVDFFVSIFYENSLWKCIIGKALITREHCKKQTN